MRAGYGERCVARQPVGPAFIAGLERPFDQQPAKPGAVDEQIPGDLFAAFERHRVDEACFAVLADRPYLALDPPDAALLGVAAKIGGVEAGIELISVGEGGFDRRRVGGGWSEPVGARCQDRQGKCLQCGHDTARAHQAEPMLVERETGNVPAEIAERMDIAVADPCPVAEFDTELEGRVGAPHEIGLIDAEPLIEKADVRHGGLADADRSDLFRLDQHDLDRER